MIQTLRPTTAGETYEPTSQSSIRPTKIPSPSPSRKPSISPSVSPTPYPTSPGDTRRPTSPTLLPTASPTPICQYDQVGPSSASKCNETGFLVPLLNPSLCECQRYCLVNGGSPPPFFFNYYKSMNTSFCFCSGSTCTIVPAADFASYKVPNATASPTSFPTPAPTFQPPYEPLPIPPSSPGERCIENGTLTPLINPTVDECWTYCSLYVDEGLSTPFYFNYYQLVGVSACYCVGKNCTLIQDPNWAPYQVNNKTIPTLGPSKAPTAV
jgi:hypothetical protein